jgi:hypothetical protein
MHLPPSAAPLPPSSLAALCCPSAAYAPAALCWPMHLQPLCWPMHLQPLCWPMHLQPSAALFTCCPLPPSAAPLLAYAPAALCWPMHLQPSAGLCTCRPLLAYAPAALCCPSAGLCTCRPLLPLCWPMHLQPSAGLCTCSPLLPVVSIDNTGWLHGKTAILQWEPPYSWCVCIVYVCSAPPLLNMNRMLWCLHRSRNMFLLSDI